MSAPPILPILTVLNFLTVGFALSCPLPPVFLPATYPPHGLNTLRIWLAPKLGQPFDFLALATSHSSLATAFFYSPHELTVAKSQIAENKVQDRFLFATKPHFFKKSLLAFAFRSRPLRPLPPLHRDKKLRRCGWRTALLAALFVLFVTAPTHAQSQRARDSATAPSQLNVIVDTDAGSDDMMAIAFLLSQPAVHIEAITVANGMAHVPAGARNVLRLLALADRSDVPVYLGRESPLSGNAEFPAEWRKNSDELPGVTLPVAKSKPESEPAAEFLASRLVESRRPVQVLALGPLTNLAEAFSKNPSATRGVTLLVIMGGAVRVPGNLDDGGAFKTTNTTAEWNIFVDAVAARKVFSSGVPIYLVPLDATQKVPIDAAFADEFQSRAKRPLARFVAQVLATDRDYIHEHAFYAWDPLAAAILVNPAIARFTPLSIRISEQPSERGRTREVPGHPSKIPSTEVALGADGKKFRTIFMSAFGIE